MTFQVQLIIQIDIAKLLAWAVAAVFLWHHNEGRSGSSSAAHS